MASKGAIPEEASLLRPSHEIRGEKRGSVDFRNDKGVSFRVRNCSLVKLNLPTMVSSYSRIRSGFLDKNGDGLPRREAIGSSVNSQLVQGSLAIQRAQEWWGKGLQPNMKDVTSAQVFVDSLLNAGNKLVVVGLFLPGCGGCRDLHLKLCQLVERNPNVQYLQVNYEKHKSMSYILNVHVLPFFRFYKSAHSRLCSFSCSIAMIKKFRGALAGLVHPEPDKSWKRRNSPCSLPTRTCPSNCQFNYPRLPVPSQNRI